MTSLSFQLRISLLLYVWLSHNLVREMRSVYVTLRLYKISCDLEGHLDLWGQLQGKRIFFLYRLICSYITPSILDWITSNFQRWFLKQRNFRLHRYCVISIFRLAYLHYLLSDWAQTNFSKIRLMVCICILTWYVIKLTRSLTKWRKPTSLIH